MITPKREETPMLMARPALLRELVERYETLRAQSASTEDVVYTLCVLTGTRRAADALAAARATLAAYTGGRATSATSAAAPAVAAAAGS
jgi:hypothetical protein